MKNMNTTHPITTKYLKSLSYPTPFYVFDRETIRDKYREFMVLLPDVAVHYAVKSNPLEEVSEILKQEGSGFEVASPNELKMLLKLGVEPDKIICSAPVKSGIFIHEAHVAGVNKFAFDSKEELERITQSAPNSYVYLRIKVTEHGSRFSLSEKFGADWEKAVEYMNYAKELKLKPYGITFHIGSQASSIYSWRYAIRTAGKAMKALKDNGVVIKVLDVGGGFPVSYLEEVPKLSEVTKSILLAMDKYLPYKPKLIIEPGRALVAESAFLVTTVFSRVRRGNRNWLFTDAGAYNSLFESLDGQTNLEYPVESLSATGKLVSKFVITGPTCDSIDVVRKEAALPKDTHVGDKLLFRNAGAYTVALANSFNGYNQPEIYFVN